MNIREIFTQKSIARGELSFEEVAQVKVGVQSDTPYLQIHSYRRNYTLYGQERIHDNFAYIEFSNWDVIHDILTLIELRIDSDQRRKSETNMPGAVGVYENNKGVESTINQVEFCIEELCVSFQLWGKETYLGAVSIPIPEKVEDSEVNNEQLLNNFKQVLDDLIQLEPSKSSRHTSESKESEYDVFLSHSSEDKNDVARPLFDELQNRGYSVWFDESEISEGEILLREIDEGMASSDFGLVLLSPDFFESAWTGTELYALMTRHVKYEDVLIPIRHNITVGEIENKSPILSSHLISSTEGQTISAVADDVENVMST